MEQKVEISKSDHALDLLAKFNEFRKSNKHCDFIIRTGEKEMPVHKFVISASSEYFATMLSHDTIECTQGVVEIKQVDPECIAKCVNFIYTGEASVSNEKQRDLMHVAHMLRLERLYNGIAVFLEKRLDCSSFYSTRQIANLYECKNLVESCNEFALKNFRAIAKLDDFNQLEADYVRFLLSSDELKECDVVKCKALMMWVNYDSDRAASLFDLMKAVDFSKVSMSYRRFLTENEPFVFNSIECLKHVTISVFDNIGTKSFDATLDKQPGIIVLDSNSARLKHFDFVEKTWNDMQAMHQNMINQYSSVVIEEECMYVLTGNRLTFRLRFKEPDATWEQMASRNGNWGAAVILKGVIYSTDHQNYSNRIERYNIHQNQWSFIANRSLTALGSAIVVLQEYVYLLGGRSNYGGDLNNVQRYHHGASSWSDAPCLRQSRWNASAAVLNGSIYAFGGYANYGGGYQQSVEILYCNSRSWQLINLNSFTRQNFSSYAIDGKIYLVGNKNSNFLTVDEYDPNTNEMHAIGSVNDKTIVFFSSVAAMI